MKAFVFFLLAASTLSAQFPSPERCWEVGGEFLYWKPCAPTYDYGLELDSLLITTLSVKPDYDAGFRIYARTDTHDCCHCWWLSWTRFETTDQDRRGPGNLQIYPESTPFESLARAQLKHRYNKVDLRAGRYVSAHCNSRYYAFGSVGYLDLERKQRSTALLESGQFKTPSKSTFEGGFIGIGTGAEIEEPCNIRLLGHFAAVAGIGKRKLQQQFDNIPLGDISTIFPSQTTCIPGLEFRVAADWRYHLACVWLSVELGYQLDYYFDALRFSRSTFSTDTVSVESSLHNIGFGGPFLGITARF